MARKTRLKTFAAHSVILASLAVGSLGLSPLVFAGGPEEVPAGAENSQAAVSAVDNAQPAQDEAPANSESYGDVDAENQNQADLSESNGDADVADLEFNHANDWNAPGSDENTVSQNETTAKTTPSADASHAAADHDTRSVLPAPVAAQSAANTTGAGFYVRGQVGYDWLRKDAVNTTAAAFHTNSEDKAHNQSYSLNQKDSRGFMGRIAAGYAINHYFSIEIGAALPHSWTRNYNYDETVNQTTTTHSNHKMDIKTRIYVLDALMKATFPVNHFYAFGGAGFAYVHQKSTVHTDVHSDLGHNLYPFIGSSTSADTSLLDFKDGYIFRSGDIRPKVVVGVGYQFTDNLSVDLEYSRIFGHGVLAEVLDSPKGSHAIKNFQKDYVPNINAVMLGVTYHFNSL